MANVAPAAQVISPNEIRYSMGDLYWGVTDITDPNAGYGTWLGAVASSVVLSPNVAGIDFNNESFGVQLIDNLDRGHNVVLLAPLLQHTPKAYELGFAPHHVASKTAMKYKSRVSIGTLRSQNISGKLLYVPYDRDNHNCILIYKAVPQLEASARLSRALGEPEIMPIAFKGKADCADNVYRKALLADLLIEPLVISNIVEASPAATTMQITWDTDRAATSKINYGTVTGVLSSQFPAKVDKSSFVTSHDLTITGLVTATTYYYTLESCDEEGNSVVSAEGSFVTA